MCVTGHTLHTVAQHDLQNVTYHGCYVAHGTEYSDVYWTTITYCNITL